MNLTTGDLRIGMTFRSTYDDSRFIYYKRCPSRKFLFKCIAPSEGSSYDLGEDTGLSIHAINKHYELEKWD